MDWTARQIRHEEPLLYQQVADDVAAAIGAGDLSPGERIPSEFDLAAVYGVARVTVRRAMAQLRERGLVVVLQGRGTFVAGAPPRRAGEDTDGAEDEG